MRTDLLFAALLVLSCQKTSPDGAPRGGLSAAKVPAPPEAKAETRTSSGVQWFEGSFEQAQGKAQAENKHLLVEVYATWCEPCQKQAADVFETEDGGNLTRPLIAWRMDFDAQSSRPYVEKWRILNLPTVLFLRADGTEIDRIEGYEEKSAFLTEANQLGRGGDPLPALLEQYERATGDDRLALQVKIGHRRLVRGDDQGLLQLERAAEGQGSAAEDALFLIGRYRSRVERDFSAGKSVWKKLYDRFPRGKYRGTAAWWYAGALHELKDDANAVDFLVRHAEKEEDAGGVELVLTYAKKYGVGLAEGRALLDKAKLDEARRKELAKLAGEAEASARQADAPSQK